MIVAAAEFASAPLDIDANAARMAALVTEAGGRGARLVVFSELALTHYELGAIAAEPERLSVTADDVRLAPVREACRASGVAAVVNAPGRVGGPVGADGSDEVAVGVRLAIASFVFGPDGELLTRYDKRHLYGPENDVFVPGAAEGRFALDGLRFALATCYDNAFPEVAASAAADGCQVYLASSFHGTPERVAQYADLARNNGLYVVLANGTGVGSAGPACGHSGAWSPSGEQVARATEITDAGRAAEVAKGPRLVLVEVGSGPDGAWGAGGGGLAVDGEVASGTGTTSGDRPAAITLMSDPRVAAIPVVESGEPLLDLRSEAPALRLDVMREDEDGAFAHLREGLLLRLLKAQELLPDGLRLLVVEGYRPPALQRRYFAEYEEELRAAHPEWTADELRAAASRYVSPPEVAPHCAGGAVDLTLVTADGTLVDMGTPLDATPEQSDGACYTEAPNISETARANRRVLGAALSAAGLVNYPTEWWHWSYGDRYWALLTGAPHALYGPKEPSGRDEPETEAIPAL
ncbi:nitrilase-related carbon-nitrogen hydrolase [Streptomyces sp. NPDC003077]|uniref:nitrilase-related carbon-nitrogen hydrolase n=1 Tax=Streptomyces sp. NPDC003077 TaxID=3154443 RepID=UPI0033A6794F